MSEQEIGKKAFAFNSPKCLLRPTLGEKRKDKLRKKNNISETGSFNSASSTKSCALYQKDNFLFDLRNIEILSTRIAVKILKYYFL